MGYYLDDAISGTGAEKRGEFNRLIADCDVGRIDIVLVKSISRFARNTVVLLNTVRHLKDIGVDVWFEDEGIHSMDGDGELMLTILASFAQEESRSISENCKWGIRKQYERGASRGCKIYGYRTKKGKLVIKEDEAAVVRRIFQMFLDGDSCYIIGKKLETEGVRSYAGKTLCGEVIANMIRQEKYTGCTLAQKLYTGDHVTHKQVRNNGELPMYFIEGTHEAIIPRELFLQVQEEMVRRARLKTGTGKRRVYCGKYALSHLMFCSHCGDIFRRTQWFIRGEHIPVWRCITRLEKRKSDVDCPSRMIYETDLHAAVVTAFNQMLAQKDEFLPGMRLAVEKALGQSNAPKVQEIDARLEELQRDLLKKANAHQDFDELADEIDALREAKQDLLLEDANHAAMKQRLDELDAFMHGHEGGVTEYDEGLVRQLIERITVYDDHLTFEFKIGLETEVQA